MKEIYEAIDEMVDEAATMLAQGMIINMRTVDYWAMKLTAVCRRQEALAVKPKKWWQRR